MVKKLYEGEVPANAMGASSSNPSTGAIDTFDPLLGQKPLKRKQLELTSKIIKKFKKK